MLVKNMETVFAQKVITKGQEVLQRSVEAFICICRGKQYILIIYQPLSHLSPTPPPTPTSSPTPGLILVSSSSHFPLAYSH